MSADGISVILPVYNGEAFLGRAIDSVLAQEGVTLELIVVNDGSDDGSAAIARRAAETDGRVRIIDRLNGGLSAARNTGIEAASMPWVSFIDADDELHPRALCALLAAVARFPEAQLASGAFTTSPAGLDADPAAASPRLLSPAQFVAEALYQRGAGHAAWGKLYDRRLLIDCRFTEGILYEDLDFFYRYALACKACAVIDTPLIFYRQHPASIVHTWSERRLDVLTVTADIERYMSINRPGLLRPARERRLSANFDMFIQATRNGRDDVADRCWRLITEYRRDSLADPRVRFKSKAGIMLSYLGKRFFRVFSRWFAR